VAPGLSRLLAIGFLLVSIGVGLFSCFFNLFSADVVGASRASEFGPGTWLSRSDAWQWDAISALGLAGAVVAAFVALACFHGRRGEAAVWGATWVPISGALLALVWHASPNTGTGLLIWQLIGGGFLIGAIASVASER
jgi:hypothetical protein